VPFRPDPFLAQFGPLRDLRNRRRWVGYGIAVLGVPAAALTKLALPLADAPFITFFPVIILAALLGGSRPGLLALLLSGAAADYFFVGPPQLLDYSGADLIAMLAFLAVAGVMIVIIGFLNRAIDRLWAQSENMNLVLDSEPAGVIGVDSEGVIELVNRTAEQQFGYQRDELYGKPIELLVPDDLRSAHVRHRRDYAQSPSERKMGVGRDLSGRRKDGSLVPIEVGLSPVRRGTLTGALATVIDISERKAAEKRQEILASEIRHRSRNLLSLIQAIALQTIPADARRKFIDTLYSLARTQDVFLSAESIRLEDIIAMELAPFHNRASCAGCDIQLIAQAAQDFALIIHELTTNAVKHGALSAEGGRVDVNGMPDGAHFILRWEEFGGPPARPPERKGFGQTILSDLARSFCDNVSQTFAETGFKYELRVRLDKISNNVIALAERRAGEPA
jgi:PAS domain S-box-containing protein